ncbi:putative tetratricopeptide-like helical domain superfamily [Dioscorea sansibarensis]
MRLLSSPKSSKAPLSNIISQNVLLSDCLNKGNLIHARELFDRMPQRTVVSWNAMISGYSKCGRTPEALAMAKHMHSCYLTLNETTFVSVLSACSRIGNEEFGKQIHSIILKSGSEDFELVGSALLNFYTSCFCIDDACRLFNLLHCHNSLLWSLMLVGFVRCNMMTDAMNLFERMPIHDVVSWTSLISGYSRSGEECGKALKLFLQMRVRGEASANEFTYDCILRVCGKLGVLDYGKCVHGCLVKCGFELDQSVCDALIGFYCNCDAVEDAIRVSNWLNLPCLSTSNTLIASLVSAGRIENAELVFHQMIERNSVTYNLMIKGYAQEGQIADSKRLFAEMPCKNIVSLNTMISVCHQNGELDEAVNIFNHIKQEMNTVTWNSMISGYIQHDQNTEALKLYADMRRSSVECSRSTFSALFRACASIGTLQQGRMLHTHLSKTPFESNTYVGTSLVDMYAKCGSIKDARTSFNNIDSPNIASWTALINALAQSGHATEAILMFVQMIKNGINPNEVTFVGLILSCGHAGMVNEGINFFNSMQKNYDLVPTLEHFACLVDLLGRSGLVKEAEKFITEMPVKADTAIWGALLNACWFCKDLEVGEKVAERMLSFDSKNITAFVVMSNIYAKLGKWQEVMKVRKRLRELNVKKIPGCSWIEVKEIVHVFCVEDRNHPQRDEIYDVLDELIANVSAFIDSDTSFHCYKEDLFLIS